MKTNSEEIYIAITTLAQYRLLNEQLKPELFCLIEDQDFQDLRRKVIRTVIELGTKVEKYCEQIDRVLEAQNEFVEPE